MSYAIIDSKVWSSKSIRGFRSAEEQAINGMNIINADEELKAIDWLPNGNVGIVNEAGQILYIGRQEAIALGV